MPAAAAARPKSAPGSARPARKAEEAEILFQSYFKSVGPRTYAAQVKRAANGNHFLVLTEGKRDEKTEEIRKTRLFVFSEDFVALFKLLHETAQFIKANPVPDEVRNKRQKFWAKQNGKGPIVTGARGEGTSRAGKRFADRAAAHPGTQRPTRANLPAPTRAGTRPMAGEPPRQMQSRPALAGR